MEIKALGNSEQDQKDWYGFLESNKPDTHGFCLEWREIVKKSFGHEDRYLICKEGEKVLGLMPSFIVKSPLFGNSVASMPYLNEGGIVATSEEAFKALLEEAGKIAKDNSCKYVELRHREPLSFNGEELAERQHKVAMRMSLEGDPDEIFGKFPAKLRSQIRRPGKSGLEGKVSGVDIEQKESVDAFYQVFSEHMRDLGTPVYPKSLFENTVSCFGQKARVITVWDKNKPVAAGITVGFGDSSEIPWASSLRSYNKQSPNMLLYWQTIKQCALDGYKFFDFGRSNPDSGTLKFKKQWGAEPRPLHWYYKLNNSEAPDVSPSNSKFEIMVKCWQKLPLPLANALGPTLTRWIP